MSVDRYKLAASTRRSRSGREEVSDTLKCGFTFAPANGEYVSPCHLRKGHEGQHEGRCLGSRATWTSDIEHDSEEEQRREVYPTKQAAEDASK
jgi:hypothetical protein